MRKIYLLLLLLLMVKVAVAQKFTIRGYVRDAASAESLIGGNVWEAESNSGTSTNIYGFFSLTLPQDSVQLVFSYVGYTSQVHSFALQKDTLLNIELTEQALLNEIIVSAEDADLIQEMTQMSSISVPIEQIKSLPALLGEVDVIKVIQLLPGVQSGSEGSSGLYVRGGGPDQNLILLDGVPVYNASHLFGFFSVFNADAINNVELIKGGFPARYGGRLSSVIDISMKEGNMKEFHGEGSIGLVASKLTLEGPIFNDKTSFIVSGRRTYIDLLARPLIKAQSDNGVPGYYFYDLNAKLNHKFSDRDRLYLSAYTGNDHAYAEYRERYDNGQSETQHREEFGLRWGNITSALRWNHMFGNKLFSNLTLTYSRYLFDIFQESEETTKSQGKEEYVFYQSQYRSGIEDWAAKLDFDYLPAPDHYIRFGVHAIRHSFSPGAFNLNLNESSTSPEGFKLDSEKALSTEWAAYAEDDWKISQKMKANLGLHYAGFYVNQHFYHSLQPRLALRYLVRDDLSLKASYVQMTQFIHLLTNSGIGLPTDLWVPATDQVPPQEAWQTALGIAKQVGHAYEFSLEGYYKSMENLIEYKEGASFLTLGTDWQNTIERGSGRSYGAELLLQKKEGRTSGWIGYTLSWTDRLFENLNFGKRFPYKYDRRHDLSVALVHEWKENVNLSASWVYGTGNAISLPITSYAGQSSQTPADGEYIYFDEVEYYGERNSFRMQAYHRLDISIEFLKETRWGERSWTFGLYNAYSRKNPFFIDLGRDEQGKPRFVQYTLFPIIPSFSYRFKF